MAIPMTSAEIVRRNFKEIMERRHLDVYPFAKHIGWTGEMLMKIVRGEVLPTLDDIDDIAIGLSIPAYLLFVPDEEEWAEYLSHHEGLEHCQTTEASRLRTYLMKNGPSHMRTIERDLDLDNLRRWLAKYCVRDQNGRWIWLDGVMDRNKYVQYTKALVTPEKLNEMAEGLESD